MGTWCIGAGCGCQNSKIKKKPVNRHSQGIEGGDDTSPGGHSCWLSWLGMSWTWRVVWSCFIARVHKNEKKTL